MLDILTHSLNAWAVGRDLAGLSSFSNIPDQLLPWSLSIHDIGKISLGFLQQSAPWLAKNDLQALALEENWENSNANCRNHGQITGKALVELGMLSGRNGEKTLLLIASHHGKLFPYSRNLPFFRNSPEKLHGRHFATLRSELISRLRELCGLPFPFPRAEIPNDTASLFALAGWVTVCDWIASDERFFGPPSHTDVERAERDAKTAISTLGWNLPVANKQNFSGLFGELFPRKLQERLYEVCTKPGIYIVEAQMGDGKSKAALWAAHQLVSEKKARGFYFALPTQITSARICKEAIIPFVNAGFVPDASHSPHVKLIHGAAWLDESPGPIWNPTFSTDNGRQSPTTEEGASCANDWFHGNKRALLAPFGVGTIDQALLGVLPVKHFFVRLAALSGKVVILDEIHSYDVYTGSLIERLISYLSKIGSTVIVLSATLTKAQRFRLLKAGGVNPPAESDNDDSQKQRKQSRITYAAWSLPESRRSAKTVRCPSSFASKSVAIEIRSDDEIHTARELANRAEHGQRVLWIRNSVANAIAAKSLCSTLVRDCGSDLTCGVLHSRFTWEDRQRNEDYWISRYQNRETKNGCILIGTQVAEQSLNLDADYLVTDLAPTDMMLQRMGRLWRFPNTQRPADCSTPITRIIVPNFDPYHPNQDAVDSFAGLSRVYDPYVLLRTLTAWQGREAVVLPDDMEALLEATYAEPSDGEPAHWHSLSSALKKAVKAQEILANGITDIWNLPILDLRDEDPFTNLSTRIIRFPTLPLVLLSRRVQPGDNKAWTFLNQAEQRPPSLFEAFRDTLPFRREIFRNSVKIPAWFLPKNETWFPPVLEGLQSGPIACAWVDGERVLPYAEHRDEGADSQAIPGMSYNAFTGLSLPNQRPYSTESITSEELVMESEW